MAIFLQTVSITRGQKSPSLGLPAAFDSTAGFGALSFQHFWSRGQRQLLISVYPAILSCHAYFMENQRGIYFNVLRMHSRTFGECLLWRLKSFWYLLSKCQTTVLYKFSWRLNSWDLYCWNENGKLCSVTHYCFTFWIKSWLPLSDFYSIKEIKCFGTS